MDLTGQRLADRYDVVRLLGEGGMGQVYEARHVELDKRVAIKVLEKELVDDGELRERFRREARITASLHHANIIEVMDFGLTDGGQPFIVMELLEGESLAQLLEREGALPVKECLEIMSQLMSGLAEAHARGIIHRDLKPDNVFLDRGKGQGQVARLLDFGISKLSGTGEEDLQLTRTGTVMGTPYYMSPEQVMGNQELDVRSDVYSAGVILYEMLTGRRPFEGSTHNEVVVRIVSDEVKDPCSLRPDMGEALASILRKAMSKDREDRYATAEALARAIECMDPGEPARSLTEVSVVEGPAAPSRRPPAWVFPAVVGSASLVLLVAVLGIAVIAIAVKSCDEPEMVTITPRGLPPDSGILLDGTLLPGEPFEIPMGEDPVTFSVEAEGYETSSFKVIPSGDQQVRIVLTKSPPSAQAATSQDEADSQSADGTKKQPRKKSPNPFRKIIRKLKN